jgi:glycosyltransferase involved in cell wall biosynthesis
MMPAISVLMTVYNSQQYLHESINSILSQSFSDFEFLIFNDGSTDGSKEVIESFNDPRIKFFDFSYNQGYVPLLNIGLEKARGKYIARMDSDDIAHPDRFQKQYTFLENNTEYIVCGSRFDLVSVNRMVPLPVDNDDIKLKLLYITPFCHPSVMFRASIFRSGAIRYSIHHMPFEDHELWVQLSHLGKFKNLPEVLLHYRIHDNNISLRERTEDQKRLKYETQIKYINKFFSSINLTHSDTLMMHQLLFKDSDFSFQELNLTGGLIRNIMDKHGDYIVPTKMVHNFLIYMYFYRCTTSTAIGLQSFLLANQFGFGKIPIIRNIRLFIKSIFKYKTKRMSEYA